MSKQQHWLELQDRVCVITGAASGIGAGIAQTLAHAGAKVALLDRNIEGLKTVANQLHSQGANVISIECDTTNEEQVKIANERVTDELGVCYAFINNAGLLRSSSLEDVSLEDWNYVLNVNLTGYLLCARTFAKSMRKAKQGALVHIASIASIFPQTNSGAYSASKASVLLMSKQMAVEWGPQGIRSNAICPGMIRTPLSAKFYEEPGFEAKRAAVTASRRVGEPQDIADVAAFLASPRAAYVNGAELVVDGGMSSMLMDMVPRPGFNQTQQN